MHLLPKAAILFYYLSTVALQQISALKVSELLAGQCEPIKLRFAQEANGASHILTTAANSELGPMPGNIMTIVPSDEAMQRVLASIPARLLADSRFVGSILNLHFASFPDNASMLATTAIGILQGSDKPITFYVDGAQVPIGTFLASSPTQNLTVGVVDSPAGTAVTEIINCDGQSAVFINDVLRPKLDDVGLAPFGAPGVFVPAASPSPPLEIVATPPPKEANSSSSTTATDAPAPSSSSNIGAIVGGVVGGLAVTLTGVIAGVFVWRRKRRNRPAADDHGKMLPVNNNGAYVVASFADGAPQDPVLNWISRHAPMEKISSRKIPRHVVPLAFGWRDVEVVKTLGQGAFGKVFLAKLNYTLVAVKVLVDTQRLKLVASSHAWHALTDDSNIVSTSQRALVKEVSIMAFLRHPNVVLLTGFCLNPPCLAIEYASRGSLYSILQQANADRGLAEELTWERRIRMAMDGAAGCIHLHSRSPQILHRDIKSPNFLVFGDWSVKCSDMGLSKLLAEASKASISRVSAGGAGNPRWLAPEVLSGKKYSTASDVYGFGIVLWELLVQQIPFSEVPSMYAIAIKVSVGTRPAIPLLSDLPMASIHTIDTDKFQRYIELMQCCWAHDPAERPSFEAVSTTLSTLL